MEKDTMRLRDTEPDFWEIAEQQDAASRPDPVEVDWEMELEDLYDDDDFLAQFT